MPVQPDPKHYFEYTKLVLGLAMWSEEPAVEICLQHRNALTRLV